MSDPITPLGSSGQVSAIGPLAVTLLPNTAQDQASSAMATGVPSKAVAAAQDTVTQAEADKTTAKNDKKNGQGNLAPATLDQASKDMQAYIKNLPSDLEFHRDEASGYTVFKLVNPITREVIREYPPKEVVEMARRLKQLDQGDGSGVLIDQQS